MAKKINEATPQTEEKLTRENENISETSGALQNDESGSDKKHQDSSDFNDFQERISGVESREKEADQREAELDQREDNLNAKEDSLNEREKALDERELALETAKPGKKTPGLEFEFEGQNFKFKDSAPKVINIDGGRKLSQKQIIADEDILLQLVGGNSGLIIKI